MPSSYGPDRRKYELAHAVWSYINYLAGYQLPLDSLYVTNICNKFLPSVQGRGVVLIPDELAQQGAEDISKVVERGNFRVIVPMAVQIFYQLCRLGYIDEEDERIQTFILEAQPTFSKAIQGIYVSKGEAPFLEVCGRRFHFRGIPLIPVVNIKIMAVRTTHNRYSRPMQRAQEEISAAIR